MFQKLWNVFAFRSRGEVAQQVVPVAINFPRIPSLPTETFTLTTIFEHIRSA